MAPSILLLNGPNLNLLGTREPDIYGYTTLSDVESTCSGICASRGATFSTFQSNHEGALIDRIHAARSEKVDFIIINPGGFTHTSVALRDALAGVNIPFIEIHISNIHSREAFRHKSFLSDLAVAVIVGLGTYGYEVALGYVLQLERFNKKTEGNK
ncbi:catabolic 3-dehydroquinase 2 [Trichophaea hybrida]|nr:catabolic 3-dehydroquinase 2 [Trichophaea hybrida]